MSQPSQLVTLNYFNVGVSIGAGRTQLFYVFVNFGMKYVTGDAVEVPVGIDAKDDSIVILGLRLHC